MAIYNPTLQPSALFRTPAAQSPPRGRILFVHGMWHGAWYWERWQQVFAEHGYESYALDLYGSGTRANDGWVWRSGIREYVECVRVALEEIGPCILIGHSMGAFVLQNLMQDYHDAPAAVLLTPVPHSGIPISKALATGRSQTSILVALTFSMPVPPLRGQALREAFFSPDIDDATLRMVERRLNRASAKATLQMILTTRPKPERITTKTLVVLADNDTTIPQNAVQILADRLPNGELKRLPDAAHDVALDTRWRDHAEKVCAWLDHAKITTPVPDLSPPPNWKHARVHQLVPRPDEGHQTALPAVPGETRELIHRPEAKA